MKILITVCFLWVIVSGCATQRVFEHKQGVTGEVRWFEGNLMPTVGDSINEERYSGRPVKRTIHIFEATRQSDAVVVDGQFFSSIRSTLIKKISTDEEGKFHVGLPPGRYSIFVVENGRLYANTFDGKNYINPVTVQPGSYTDIQISINYKAYY